MSAATRSDDPGHPAPRAHAAGHAPISAAAIGRLYWACRLGIAFIWLWTAYACWYVVPQAVSLDLLRSCGVTSYTAQVFAAACLVDLAMGLASLLFARTFLWWCQCALVASYSLVIGLFLPAFLFDPFGPISKNICVLICLAFLAMADRRVKSRQ